MIVSPILMLNDAPLNCVVPYKYLGVQVTTLRFNVVLSHF